MKKILKLFLFLLLLGIGYLAYDFATSKEPLLTSFTDQVADLSGELMERSTPAKKQIGTVLLTDEQKWSQYCESKEGVIAKEVRNGQEVLTCFINDGKDGIRCRADLFYQLKCGLGEPVLELGKTVIHRNTDATSNVAAVVVSENREGMAFLTKEYEGERQADRIVMRGNDGSLAEVVFGNLGLPEFINYEGTVLAFEEYLEDSVRLKLTRSDGSSETFTRAFDTSAFQAQVSSWLIPSAYAVSAPDGTLLSTLGEYISENAYDSMPIGAKAIHYAASKAAEQFCSNEEGDCFLYEMPDFGTAISTIGCGLGLGSILFTGGATSPFAYLGCAGLAVRFETIDSKIGPCEGDLLNCGSEAIVDLIQKEGFDLLPGVLSEGFNLHGIISNSVNRQPVQIGTLNATSPGQADVRGDFYEGGSYRHYFETAGNYTITAVAEGYQDKTLSVQISSSRVRISDGNKTEEFPVKGQDYLDVTFDFVMDPEAYIVGEVIDSVEGEPIVGAKVILEVSGKEAGRDTTFDDGTFSINPLSVGNPNRNLELRVSASGYEAKTLTSSFHYELKPNSDLYDSQLPEVIKLDPAEEEVAEEEIAPSISYAGVYNATFSRPSNTYVVDEESQIGANVSETTTGSISVTVSEDHRASCYIVLSTNFITEIEGFDPVGGSGTGESQSCSGFVDQDNGTLVLSGMIRGTLKTAGQQTTEEGPFNVTGLVREGQMSGSINVEGAEDIPF